MCYVTKLGPNGKPIIMQVDPKAKGAPSGGQTDFTTDVAQVQAPGVEGLEGAEVSDLVGVDVTHAEEGDRVTGALGDCISTWMISYFIDINNSGKVKSNCSTSSSSQKHQFKYHSFFVISFPDFYLVDLTTSMDLILA